MGVSRAGWMQKTRVQEVKHFHKLAGPQTQAPSQGGTRGWSEGRAEHPRRFRDSPGHAEAPCRWGAGVGSVRGPGAQCSESAGLGAPSETPPAAPRVARALRARVPSANGVGALQATHSASPPALVHSLTHSAPLLPAPLGARPRGTFPVSSLERGWGVGDWSDGDVGGGPERPGVGSYPGATLCVTHGVSPPLDPRGRRQGPRIPV